MNTHTNIRGRIFRIAFLALALAALPSPIFGYGDEGHKTVGAIADKLIANSPNTVAHVRALIGNTTLERTAIWADDAKYSPNPNDPEMMAFINANAHHSVHDHWDYHFTDIPIQETHYRALGAGAKNTDIVHMIRNCIAILEGHSNSTNNPTNIPPKTALRLLVHYVGDIHQPLHVGAVYFGPNAQPANPNTTANFKFATGGNAINFAGTNLHSYWDGNTVKRAMADAHAANPGAFAQILIANPPQGWDSGPFMSGWSVKWANEMIPISTLAHNKLSFGGNGPKWTAQTNDLPGYDQWAAAQVRTEIARAGYRLAAILKKIWP
jgi:hypothetical protein